VADNRGRRPSTITARRPLVAPRAPTSLSFLPAEPPEDLRSSAAPYPAGASSASSPAPPPSLLNGMVRAMRAARANVYDRTFTGSTGDR